MIQKIIQVGNSAGMTLPRSFLKEAGLKVGDELSVETNGSMKMLIAQPKKNAKKTTLTPEFKQWLDEFMDEYRPILKKLAHT